MSGVRLAYVTRQYPPAGVGGIGRYVQVVGAAMAEAGHDVTVINAADGQRRSTEVVSGVTVERFPGVELPPILRRAAARRPGGATRLLAAVSAARAVRALGPFDVVEAPEWKAEGLLLRWLRRGKVVVHLHLADELATESSGHPAGRVRLGPRLERWSASAGHAVTACSRLSNRRIDGSPWVADEAVRLVVPPLAADRWAGCAPVAATEPVVLLLGHLEQRKGPDVLLDALARLREDVPGLRAVVAGRALAAPDGRPYDRWLEAEAPRFGLDVEVLGATTSDDEVLALFGRARVVAVPSRFETLSMVALEALACGRPVVVTTRVGAREWVGEPGCTAVPVADPAALADALRPFLLDPVKAAEAGAAGRDAVVRACSPAEVVRSRLDVYREVVGAGG